MKETVYYVLMENEKVIMWADNKHYVQLVLKGMQERSHGNRPLYIKEMTESEIKKGRKK